MKLIYFSLIIIFSSVIYIIYLLSSIIPKPDDMGKCLEYEKLGYIGVGNCACAKKLFPDFSKSYDWMDACYILSSKK